MPFRPSTPADTLSAILHDDPPELPRAAAIALSLERILRHCLEKTPEERFQNVRDVIFDLEACARRMGGGATHLRLLLLDTSSFGCAAANGRIRTFSVHPLVRAVPRRRVPSQRVDARCGDSAADPARYHNIQTACPRPTTDGFAPGPPRLARNARIYRITLADGSYQFVNTTSKPMVDTPKRGQAQNRAGASIQ